MKASYSEKGWCYDDACRISDDGLCSDLNFFLLDFLGFKMAWIYFSQIALPSVPWPGSNPYVHMWRIANLFIGFIWAINAVKYNVLYNNAVFDDNDESCDFV